MGILYMCFKMKFNSPVRIYGIRSVRYDSIKGQIRVLHTNYLIQYKSKRLRSKRRSSPCIF